MDLDDPDLPIAVNVDGDNVTLPKEVMSAWLREADSFRQIAQLTNAVLQSATPEDCMVQMAALLQRIAAAKEDGHL